MFKRLVLCYVIFLAGCTLPISNASSNDLVNNNSMQKLYIVPIYPGNIFSPKRLKIIDVADWRIDKHIRLPNSSSSHLNIDPQGRIWIGYDGDFSKGDNRVQIYSQAGALLHDLTPCRNPDAGIHFIANRVFIVCELNGFSGKVVVLNLETLEIEADIDLGIPDSTLLLTTSAVDENRLVVSAYGRGPIETSYTNIVIIDPISLKTEFLPILSNVHIDRVISYEGRFYMFNAASWRQSRDNAQDVLILDVDNPLELESMTIAPSPVWGVIEDDILYAHHNPEYGQAHTDSTRLFSRTNLRTGETEVWPLPDKWNALDIEFINGQVVMPGLYRYPQESRDGLYTFDFESGELSLLLELDDGTSKLLYVDP